MKAVVDIFSHEAYYQVSELESLKPVFFAEQKEISANDAFMQIPEGASEEGIPFNDPVPANEGNNGSSAEY